MPDTAPQNLHVALIGADMNCYSMARTFHEAYGIKCQAFGRYAMGETKYSRIVDFTAVLDIDTDPVLLETMKRYAEAYAGCPKLILGCTDDYAALAIRNRDALTQMGFTVPYISAELMEKLVSKDSFYSYCDQYAIPYPATVVVEPAQGKDPAALPGLFSTLPFAYPVIIKPASSIDYWKFPFPGMKKVYFAGDAAEAAEITTSIYASGYPHSLIVQDLIPGGDCEMRVLTAYCDKDCQVKMVCLGNVMLEEHTPKAIGNHAAILTEYNEELMQKLAHFLTDIGYTGFANFDIKYDKRDGQYKVFEINLRQGRSNYYVTGAGLNLAKLLVEDRVLGQDLGEPIFYGGQSYWHSVPNDVVWEYTENPALVEKAKQLVATGRETTALDYAYDTRLNPLRWLYIKEHYRRYRAKYATYCTKQGQA